MLDTVVFHSYVLHTDMGVSKKTEKKKETSKQSSHSPGSPYLQVARLPRLEAWFNIIAWSGFVAYLCYSAYRASQGSYVCHSLLSVPPTSHI